MSGSVLHTLPIQTIGDKNKLYVDYLEDPQTGIGGCVHGFSRNVSFWRKLVDAPAGDKKREHEHLWRDVICDVVTTSERAGSSADILTKLEKAGDERVLFVVTGQQTGFAGGPLLTLYKALTTVVFADWLQTRLSIPTIPLFWIAADDTDFDEIRSLFMLTSDMSPLSTSISDKAHDPGMPTGDIGIEPVSDSLANVSSFIEAFAGSGCIREWISHAQSCAKDNGEFFASIVSSMSGGRLAFVDGRSEALRKFSKPLFAGYLEREEEIKQQVIERGGQLRANGYHAQLSPGKDSGIFILEDGRRRTVPPDRISSLRDAIDTSIEKCSPGVILRNLIQDYVFRPIAVVLGPAELAYRAQITDVYDTFAIERPSVIPRMTATFLPPSLCDVLEGEQPHGYESLIRAPSRFAATLYDQFIPSEMRFAIEQFRDDIAQGTSAVRRAADGAMPDKLRKRLTGRLSDIERRIEQLRDVAGESGKLLALAKHPFLLNIETVIRPQNKQQERILSCLTPFMFAGEVARDAILEASKHHIAELMDGRPCHIVYSA
jgi:uncharacterized protein YllA (UPF0747 family)